MRLLYHANIVCTIANSQADFAQLLLHHRHHSGFLQGGDTAADDRGAGASHRQELVHVVVVLQHKPQATPVDDDCPPPVCPIQSWCCCLTGCHRPVAPTLVLVMMWHHGRSSPRRRVALSLLFIQDRRQSRRALLHSRHIYLDKLHSFTEQLGRVGNVDGCFLHIACKDPYHNSCLLEKINCLWHVCLKPILHSRGTNQLELPLDGIT
mmetsp:Transcript_16351/g.27008  ORF Transcript_16351/g.27008 Transcript_16351/m.27008 type:complete len:208 (-) Transcript_16351:3283-3906(-)